MSDDECAALVLRVIHSCPVVRRSSVVRSDAEQSLDRLIEAPHCERCVLSALLRHADASAAADSVTDAVARLKLLAFVALACDALCEAPPALRSLLVGAVPADACLPHRLHSAMVALDRADADWCATFTVDDWCAALHRVPASRAAARRAVAAAHDDADLRRLVHEHPHALGALFEALPRVATLSQAEFRLFARLWQLADVRELLLRVIGFDAVLAWCSAVRSDAFLSLWHSLRLARCDEMLRSTALVPAQLRVCVTSADAALAEAAFAWLGAAGELDGLLAAQPQLVEQATLLVRQCAALAGAGERQRMAPAVRFCANALRSGRASERDLQFCFEQFSVALGELQQATNDDDNDSALAVAIVQVLSEVLAGATDPTSAFGERFGAVCVALFVVVDSLSLTSAVIAACVRASESELMQTWLRGVAQLWDAHAQHCFGELVGVEGEAALVARVATLCERLASCAVQCSGAAFECFAALADDRRSLVALLRADAPTTLCRLTQSACAHLNASGGGGGGGTDGDLGRVAVNAGISLTTIVTAALSGSGARRHEQSAALAALQAVAASVLRAMADVLQQLDPSALTLARTGRLVDEWLECMALLCDRFVAVGDVTGCMWTDGLFGRWADFLCGRGAGVLEARDAARFAVCVRNLLRTVNALQSGAAVCGGAGDAARAAGNARALARVVRRVVLPGRARLLAARTGTSEEVFALVDAVQQRVQREAAWRAAWNRELEEVDLVHE
jgi:hypothetical protein